MRSQDPRSANNRHGSDDEKGKKNASILQQVSFGFVWFRSFPRICIRRSVLQCRRFASFILTKCFCSISLCFDCSCIMVHSLVSVLFRNYCFGFCFYLWLIDVDCIWNPNTGIFSTTFHELWMKARGSCTMRGKIRSGLHVCSGIRPFVVPVSSTHPWLDLDFVCVDRVLGPAVIVRPKAILLPISMVAINLEGLSVIFLRIPAKKLCCFFSISM